MGKKKKPELSDLEQIVMQVVWAHQGVTAEQVRNDLADTSPMKDSTARTILRRLEKKGFVTHSVEGRTYIYSSTVQRKEIAAGAVEGIIEKFCSGSVEELLLGLVDSHVLSSAKLKQLAEKISQAEHEQSPRKDK